MGQPASFTYVDWSRNSFVVSQLNELMYVLLYAYCILNPAVLESESHMHVITLYST